MNVQYDLTNHTLEDNRAILHDAMSYNYEWWVDILKGLYRNKIEMSFEDVMKFANETCYYTCFYRDRGYYGLEESHYEFGFRTMSSDTYFLWILVGIEAGQKIIEKYNIQQRDI